MATKAGGPAVWTDDLSRAREVAHQKLTEHYQTEEGPASSGNPETERCKVSRARQVVM